LRLTVLLNGQSWTVADAGRVPRHVVRGATGLASASVAAHVLHEAHFLAGEDATGALVALGPETRLVRPVLAAILDRGGIGFITDFCKDRFVAPDMVPSVALADDVIAGETRPFVGVSVSPRVGDRIRTLAMTGVLESRVDGGDEVGRAAGDATGTSRLRTATADSAETSRPSVAQGDIVGALRAVGVGAGDFLLVHSSLSALGWVEGGAGTVLSALREAVGPEGTVLFPAFTCCFRTLGVCAKTWDFRPFDPNDTAALRWTGSLARELLRTEPGTLRSRHLTNSWTGFGPRAAWALADHEPTDPPFGANSPLAKALEAKGKAVFLGADVKSCTFLHHVEDRLDLPGIGPALISVAGADGERPRDVVIPRQVPGEREFYKKGEEAKFFVEAKARGLAIPRAPLGTGLVKAIELDPLWRIATAICREERGVLATDSG